MNGKGVYTFRDYKELLKEQIRWLKEKRPHFTLRWLADAVDIQYTYLSKVLNDDSTHLNEDQLHRVAVALEFLVDEVDFLQLLRSYSVTRDSQRRDYLIRKIEEISSKRVVRADYQKWTEDEITGQMSYLIDPVALLVLVALEIEALRVNPMALCSHLGITHAKLQAVLATLSRAGSIILGRSAFEVVEVKEQTLHFGREHPLMRIHQSLIKTQLQSRLSQTAEEDKESFVATFVMDSVGKQRVKSLFQSFLAEVQAIYKESSHQQIYQMSFDLVKWF